MSTSRIAAGETDKWHSRELNGLWCKNGTPLWLRSWKLLFTLTMSRGLGFRPPNLAFASSMSLG